MSKKSRKRFICMDCDKDTGKLREFYMVKDSIWSSVVKGFNTGMLCVSCLETRLGRTLSKEDFQDCIVNHSRYVSRSDLLHNRMTK